VRMAAAASPSPRTWSASSPGSEGFSCSGAVNWIRGSVSGTIGTDAVRAGGPAASPQSPVPSPQSLSALGPQLRPDAGDLDEQFLELNAVLLRRHVLLARFQLLELRFELGAAADERGLRTVRGQRERRLRLKVGHTRERAVVARGLGFAPAARARIREPGALGRQLSLLLEPAADAGAGEAEGLPHRHAAALVDVRPVRAERLDEIVGEQRLELLGRRVGGGEHDAPSPRDLAEKRKARR